jgi:hypothetical protein
MTAEQVAADIGAVKNSADAILTAVEGAVPGEALPLATAGAVIDELGTLIQAAVTAWSNASGTPITVETLQALLPNATPLPEPPAGT